ncbi:hypothetical protein SAMN05444580_11051 [Rhodococcus tukisamuensis]|uniref:Uncharacterized protein n=1 Tax=Rhodococcus tukisamuensis TaxID=168276 RepID=A0A1G7A5C0_9NOCA|nr:hypothetical protein SAMN05444580_11051 [Rhodococcus tukisamuensis]
MSRNLARRGASVLVAAALLGGGLALGGGTASAEEPNPAIGDSFQVLLAAIVLPLTGSAAGPVQSGSAAVGSSETCSGAYEGVPRPGCLGFIRILPSELAAS